SELERRYIALVEEWESKNGIAKGLVGLRIGLAGDMWRFERFEEYTHKIYEGSKLKPQEDKKRKYICTLDAMLDLSTQFLKLGLDLLREEKWGVSGLVGESAPGWQSDAEEVVRLWLQRPVLEDQERDGVEVLGRARLVLAEGCGWWRMRWGN
ncbi:hypothetical protein BGX38DRAFT_1281325, partial [Terfezia claveryi]